MNKLRKIIVCVLALAMLVSIGAVSAFAADDASKLALDVVFVIDASGSMQYQSDPKGIAKEACKLFVDICDSSNTRVGYVAFSERIEAQRGLTSIADKDDMEDFIKSIGEIKYDTRVGANEGGTDYSLGLEIAEDMLTAANSAANGRTPMIILLSDGVKDKINPEREANWDNRFNETINTLASTDVPVYTIALGEGGNLNMDNLKSISEKTGGFVDRLNEQGQNERITVSKASSAADLPKIMADILAARIRSKVQVIAEVTATGGEQTIKIDIPDGIYQANIILQSQPIVKVNKLTDPSGNEANWNQANHKYEKKVRNLHKVITIKQPVSGSWELSFTGQKDTKIVVSLMNNYDMQFELIADKYTVTNGDTVKFTVNYLVPGKVPTDAEREAIFNNADIQLTLAHDDGVTVETLALSWANNEMSGTKTFAKQGTYSVVGSAIGPNSSYGPVNTSSIEVKVNPTPLVTNGAEIKKTILSPFLGIPLFNKTELEVTSLFTSYDKDAKFEITETAGAWENIVDYDDVTNPDLITITAKKSGNAEIALNITDGLGSQVAYLIRVSVFPSWVIVLGALLLIAIIVVVIILIKRARRPLLKGTLKVSTTLPMELANMTPPEAELPLSILNHKGKISLDKLLASNLTICGQYNAALSAIADFVNKIEFEAANADSSNLYIYIPASDKAATVQYNNAPVDKALKRTISVNTPATLSYSALGSQYTFTFSFKDENGFGNEFGGDSNFGNGGFGNGGGFGGGFGGFGGNDQNAGGFGGFGGNDQSAGGFGGFGGGNDQSAGGFGGFGGGNDQSAGGFGGFGGNDQNAGGFGGFGGGNNQSTGGFGGF